MTTASINTTTGPKAEDSKRIASRNATTHGLFARDVVLPRLGEDPQAYEAFLQELTNQLSPKNLLEQHYAEKIAAASWRLRRLHRWQAQLFEDMEMPEDEVLAKLDRVMRHETTLHRQIDTSVKMLGRELPKLFEGRVREDLLRRLGGTERTLKDDPYLDQWLTAEARKRSSLPTCPPSLDLSRLDTVPVEQENCQNEPSACTGMACHAPADHAPTDAPHTECQNEPAPTPVRPQSRRDFPSLEVSPALQSRAMGANCQNQPAPCHPSSPCSKEPSRAPVLEVSGLAHSEGFLPEGSTPPELGAGGQSSPTLAPHPWGGGASSPFSG